MYSRNWGGLETGSLGMAESGGVVERCEGLGCREIGRDWSGVMGWRVGGPYGTPGHIFFLQTDQGKQLSSEKPWFCMAGRQELLWAIAGLVLK